MWKWIVFLGIVITSCKSLSNISTFSVNNKRITFEKTRVELSSKNFGSMTLKGYINMVKDSSLCFKFYGPFSYPVVSGVYIDTFKVFNHVNNSMYRNLDNTIFNQTGVVIDRDVVEYLLLGKVNELKAELIRLNGSILRIESIVSSKKPEITVFKGEGQRQFKFYFYIENQIPKSILIDYKDSFTSWSVNIKNVRITNHSKKCNFEF